MALTLVTGGTGLVGSHVVRQLVARGDDVRIAVRDGSLLDNLGGLDVDLCTADVLDRSAVRRAMRGVERVFHCAGMTSLRAGADALFRANVDGSRIVLEEALRAGVQRATYTSSVAAVGPAPRGSTADETQTFRAGRYGLPYVNAKHEAETVALRVAAHGLDLVIVNPAHVFGRGDLYRSSTELVRRFLRRELPAYVDGALNVVDAEDVARGIVLADERGRAGERYILGNRNFTLDRLFADLGRLSGIEPPALKLPLPAALALARTAEALPGRPAITTTEVRLRRCGGPTGRRRRGGSWAGSPPTTRTRCSRRSTGTASASRCASARPAPGSRSGCAWPAWACAARAGSSAGWRRSAVAPARAVGPDRAPGRTAGRQPRRFSTESGAGRAGAAGSAATAGSAGGVASSATPSACASSPLSYISTMMSEPPSSSPPTKSCGIVGQPEIADSSWRMRGSGRMSTAAKGEPVACSARDRAGREAARGRVGVALHEEDDVVLADRLGDRAADRVVGLLAHGVLGSWSSG